MVSLVKDTQGAVRNKKNGADFTFFAELWLILEDFEIEFFELLSDWFVELEWENGQNAFFC